MLEAKLQHDLEKHVADEQNDEPEDELHLDHPAAQGRAACTTVSMLVPLSEPTGTRFRGVPFPACPRS